MSDKKFFLFLKLKINLLLQTNPVDSDRNSASHLVHHNVECPYGWAITYFRQFHFFEELEFGKKLHFTHYKVYCCDVQADFT